MGGIERRGRRRLQLRVSSTGCIVLAVAALAASAATEQPQPRPEGERPVTRLGLGWLADLVPDPALEGLEGQTLDELHVRVVADRSAIESVPGEPDWGALPDQVERLRSAGARVALVLTGDVLPSPFEPGAVETWTRFVRAAVARFGGSIDTLGIWDRASSAAARIDVETYAYVLKTSAVAARAAARERGASFRVAQAAIGPADLDWQKALWQHDVAAYADILPLAVELDERSEIGPALEALLGEIVLHPPAPEVWVEARAAAGADPWLAAAAAAEALAHGAAAALVGAPVDSPSRAELARWTLGTRRLLAGDLGPSPLPAARFARATGEALRDARALGAFLDDETFRTLLFFRVPGPSSESPTERLLLETAFVQGGRLVDPLSGREQQVGSSTVGASPRERSFPVWSAPWPLVLQFERPELSAGFDIPPEEIETRGSRELTAEEIIARYQQVQKLETDHLERWTARGRIDYHFRFVQGGSTIDVSIDTHYYWERGGELEWEELDYYINGNIVPWKHFPQIPLIQPEKVITLPLDLTLDRNYAYRRVGRERVEGRDAYVLEFEPADPAAPASLYRGRVWIDAEDFHRAKTSLVQTQLESPVLSNEEIDRFGAQVDPEGRTYWMLDTIDGQQVWNTAGRNFVVRREVSFLEYEINPPAEEFAARRERAYASENNMMRDTREGFRYLERQPDGTRTPTPPRQSQWFAAAGAFADSSTSGVQPLAGANYFNFDLAGSGIQFNALIGGVVNFVTASKPDLGGGDLSLTADLFASALYFEDQLFFEDQELEEQSVSTRTQRLNLRLGWHTAPFVKLNLIGAVAPQQYDTNDDGDEALARYNETHPGQALRPVLPPNHTELSAGVQLEANRRGYSLVAGVDVTERSEWGPVGLFDDAAGSFVDYDPATGTYVPSATPAAEKRFVRFGVDVFKEWYLPSFQKVRAEVNYLDGSRLDRFSKYQFNQFGDDRLSGFAGTGVRFDRAAIGRAGYSFNVLEVIRLDAVLENAWIREEAVPGTRSFAGIGLSANFVGPWKTVYSVSYGRALASDIPALDDSDEFFVLILKLF